MPLIYPKTYTSLSAILCLILIFSSSRITNSQNQTSVYEILSDYNFPIGILPKGVIGYDLDSTTGKFSAFLNGTCSFSIEGYYQLSYKSTIKGYISRGRLTNLEGVSVKLLFMWVGIIEVSRSGNDLEFSVGIAGAGFPIDSFEECPQCGCGLKCGDEKKATKFFRSNPVVSSL